MWKHFPPSQLDRALHTPPMHLIIWYIFFIFFCIYSIVYDHACKLFTMVDRVVQEESRSTGYVYVLYHSTELSSLFLHERSNLDQETFPISVIFGWHHQLAILHVLLFSHHIEWSHDCDHHRFKDFFHCQRFNKYKWTHGYKNKKKTKKKKVVW
jgi:hypothetical protein